MKKKTSFILFLLSLSIFLGFRFIGISKKAESYEVFQKKPCVPEPLLVKNRSATKDDFSHFRSHRWLVEQPHLKTLSKRVVEDLSLLEKFCLDVHAERQALSFEEIEKKVIDTLLTLQKAIPFTFSADAYNVLFIPDSHDAAYQVHQRLYLGDSSLGLPVYLDVRVYSVLAQEQADQIVKKQIQVFQEGMICEPLLDKGFLIRGISNEKHGHGFANMQQERGMFLYPMLEGGKLYLAYLEAPWETFQRFIDLFSTLKIK